MAEVYFKKDAFDEAIIPDAAFEQTQSDSSEVGVYCKAHFKEGLTQNRLLYNAIHVKKLEDSIVQCDLCREQAEVWIG
jgi:hypothetical protein